MNCRHCGKSYILERICDCKEPDDLVPETARSNADLVRVQRVGRCAEKTPDRKEVWDCPLCGDDVHRLVIKGRERWVCMGLTCRYTSESAPTGKLTDCDA